MQINSIAEYSQYNKHKELNNKYENKRIRQESEQDVSFADVMQQIRSNSYKNEGVKQSK